MSIFTKPMSALTFEDLTVFLATREPEGLRIEYKASFPKHEDLARAVAAMANADGGIILLGIPADSENRPKEPTGIPKGGNIPDRIANICAAKIRPGIAPDVRVFELKDPPGGCVVILRVPSSNLAPHYLPDYFGDPLIPVRIDGKISSADVPTIEALQQRRRGDVAAAKRQAGMGDPPRAMNVYKAETGRTLTEEEAFPTQIFVYAIHGPEKLCTLTHDLDEQLRDMLPYKCLFDASDIDFQAGHPMLRKVSGFKIQRSQDDVRFTCAGLDREKPTCIVVRVTESGGIQFGTVVLRNEFYLGRLITDVKNTLKFAKAFFERVSYFGQVEFELTLENVNLGGTVAIDLLIVSGQSYKYKSKQHVQVKATFEAAALAAVPNIIKDILRRVLREGNVPVAEGFLDQISEAE
jgi:hypothetical protein